MRYYKEIFSGDFYDSGGGIKWRKYSNFEESFADHADFLQIQQHNANDICAFAYLQNVMCKATNPL